MSKDIPIYFCTRKLLITVMAKNYKINQYLRCIVGYSEFKRYRTLHFAVRCDCVSSFTEMIKDTFVHPDINYTDIIYSYDKREFFNII